MIDSRTAIRGACLAAALLAAGCERAAEPVANREAPATTDAAPAAPAAPITPPAAPTPVFTSLATADCRVIERTAEEGGWLRQLCRGPAGYALELTEGDLRQNLLVVRPDGTKDDLRLTSLARGGGFSALGKTAEWLLTEDGAPRTLTVRFGVQEKAPPAPDVSYLVVARLEAPACVVAVVPPAPGQNERVRAMAGRETLPACLPETT